MKIKKIRIRMYRQGLGDCFLLSLFDWMGRRSHMLIDCGVITGTKDPKVIMDNVANNIFKETHGEIDRVVITHEHWDHVSGFKQSRDIFNKMKFNEVWMAWTEDPDNKFAEQLRKAREESHKGTISALAKLRSELAENHFLTAKQKEARKEYLEAVEQVTSFNGELGAGKISSTKEALDYVRTKIQSNPFYCHPDRDPFVIDNIDGLRFYILGPPKNEKLIKMDFSKKEVYQKPFESEYGNSFVSAMSSKVDQQSTDIYLPFDPGIGISSDDLAFNEEYSRYNDLENAWRKIDYDWMDFCGQLALALDSDTNNTSLAFAIELVDRKKFLLFTGDAQVGNWLSWYELSWKVENKEGKTEIIDIQTILKNTIFYKVGHHGSYNATLREKGLELMTDSDLVAMIPVDRPMADQKGWLMPFPSLLDRLNEKTSGKVIIADEKLPDEGRDKPPNISNNEWSRFIKNIPEVSNDLFIDYVINC